MCDWTDFRGYIDVEWGAESKVTIGMEAKGKNAMRGIYVYHWRFHIMQSQLLHVDRYWHPRHLETRGWIRLWRCGLSFTKCLTIFNALLLKIKKNYEELSPLLVQVDVLKPGNLSKSLRHLQATGNSYSTNTPSAIHHEGWLDDEFPLRTWMPKHTYPQPINNDTTAPGAPYLCFQDDSSPVGFGCLYESNVRRERRFVLVCK